MSQSNDSNLIDNGQIRLNVNKRSFIRVLYDTFGKSASKFIQFMDRYGMKPYCSFDYDREYLIQTELGNCYWIIDQMLKGIEIFDQNKYDLLELMCGALLYNFNNVEKALSLLISDNEKQYSMRDIINTPMFVILMIKEFSPCNDEYDDDFLLSENSDDIDCAPIDEEIPFIDRYITYLGENECVRLECEVRMSQNKNDYPDKYGYGFSKNIMQLVGLYATVIIHIQ